MHDIVLEKLETENEKNKMCFIDKKKKYTYLSMCSFCNVISKYSSAVKKHIKTQHKKSRIVKNESRVVPVRIENKFENIIRRTLDKNSKGKLKEKNVNIIIERNESIAGKGRIYKPNSSDENKTSQLSVDQQTNSIANSRPVRKRKPPKWLENEDNNIPVKTMKICSISKNRDGKSEGKKIYFGELNKCSKPEEKRTCKHCEHIVETDLEMLNHIRLMHPFEMKSLNKDKEVIKNTKDVENTKIAEVLPKDNSLPEVDSEKFYEVSKQTTFQSISNEFKDKENEPDFGDSDDDFEPEHSDGDSDENEGENSKSLECIFCDRTYRTKGHLYLHMKKKHEVDMKHDLFQNCKNYQRSKPRSVILHEKEVEDGQKYVTKYKCPFCEFHLYHYEYMKSHVHVSHPEVTSFRICLREYVKLSSCEEEWETFKCPNPKCDFVCQRKTVLQDHILSCAGGRFKNENILCQLPKAWMEKLESTVSLVCPHCDTVVNGKESFENHLKEHFPDNNYELKLNSCLPPPPPTSKHKNRNETLAKLKELECMMSPYCELVTTQKAQLTKHFKRYHSNHHNHSVILCTLANQSSVKETAKLAVEKTENIHLAAVPESEGQTAEHETAKDSTEQSTGIKHIQTVYIQSVVPAGKYICPLCNDFRTPLKKNIKLHMDKHNDKTNGDIDSVFVIPDKWIKLDEQDRQYKCQFCDFTSEPDLTLGMRHILDCHKDVTVNKSKLVLFEMRSVPVKGVKEKHEKEKYKCKVCAPGFIFKTKKGLQLHLRTRHHDKDSVAVYETMYQMLDVVIDTCDTRLIYKCCLCSKGLVTKSELLDHFQTEHPDNFSALTEQLNESLGGNDDYEQTKCEVCDRKFTDASSLRHHLILHVNRFKLTCTLCDKYFQNRPELETHNMEVHSKTGEMCYKCGAMFPSTRALKIHIQKHEQTQKGDNRILCQHCGTSVMATSIKKHLVDRHIELVSCNCDVCGKQQVPEGQKFVKCKQCDAVFCAWYNLRGHIHREHNLGEKKRSHRCKKCNLTFSSRKDSVIHSHKCGIIPDESQSRAFINKDKVLGSDDSSADITVTEAAYIDFSLGSAYIRQNFIHVDKDAEKPYSCKLCPSSFTKLSYVYNHLRRMHTSDEMKRLHCKICKMGFMDKKDFAAHCRSHLGLRQYQCSVCQKRYKTQNHLKEHTQIHMSQTYRYPCGYCGLEFNQRGALLAHVVHHDRLKPFKCLYCEKGFTSHGDLQRHMMNYSKQLKFAGTKKLTFCDYCSKDFPNHNALVKHFQIHLPVSPFQCTVCLEKFSSFRQMYNHKAKKQHFSEVDTAEGKMDLETPGRKFRRYKVSKRKTEIESERKRGITTQNRVKLISENTSGVLSEDENVIKIEIDSSGLVSAEKAKVVIEDLENEIIRSMLDADPEVINSIDFQNTKLSVTKEQPPTDLREETVLQEGYDNTIPGQNDYHINIITLQDMYETAKDNLFVNTEQTSQNDPVSDSRDDTDIVTVETVQQQQEVTISGRTQTFQTTDGTVLHVCMIKPDK